MSTTVHRDLEIGEDRFALLVETQHGSITARTAVHRQDFRRRVGGARFVRQGDVAEVGHLAAGMTWKCAAAYIPADGEKSVITCPDGIPATLEERATVLGAHLAAVAELDPGVIFGPDMNNPEAVLDRIAAGKILLDHITGLTEAQGGFSIDKRGYTAHGVAAAIRAAVEARGLELKTASVQGFGAVGAHTARILNDRGVDVVAVSTVRGALIAESGGLDVPMLFDAWRAGGDAAFAVLEDDPPAGTRFDRDADALLAVPADVFVPSARTSVLAMPDQLAIVHERENPDCKDVTRFRTDTGVKVIAEGANHPITVAGEAHLEDDGVVVLTDFIANCGGMIGCFVEWAYRDECRASAERREALHEKTLVCIDRIVARNVKALLASPKGTHAASMEIAENNRSELLAHLGDFPDDPDGRRYVRSRLDELLG